MFLSRGQAAGVRYQASGVEGRGRRKGIIRGQGGQAPRMVFLVPLAPLDSSLIRRPPTRAFPSLAPSPQPQPLSRPPRVVGEEGGADMVDLLLEASVGLGQAIALLAQPRDLLA